MTTPARTPIPQRDLADQLATLGVQRDGVLLVHCAFSAVGPVEGGPNGLIDALLTVLGPHGTLAMPSMSDDDGHVFDPDSTPCTGMGIVAETFRTRTGVRRSDSHHAFAAIGEHAKAISAPHPLQAPHGEDSPVGRIAALDGQVLLLGVGHDGNTTVHLAEELAGVRYRQPMSSTVAGADGPMQVEYDEPDHCCLNFARMDAWLGAAQHIGIVGHGPARLMRARDVVAVALDRLRADETCFLHARGKCEECDGAWDALDKRSVRQSA